MQDSRLPFCKNEVERRVVNRECAQSGVGMRWRGELTDCLAPTVVYENELRISTLDQSEFPSDTTGYILSGTWNESILGFHYFDLLNARVISQEWVWIS